MKESDTHPATPLAMTVHAIEAPDLGADRRTVVGRWKMLAVLAVCATPVIASYLAYYLVRPDVRSNYSELILPPRPMPDALPIRALDGAPVAPADLQRQWLLISVADGGCDERCEANLVLMRQLRETLGRDKDRVEKLWFVTGGRLPAQATLDASGATALQVPRAEIERWLEPAPGRALQDHLYLVDPMGQWMMRVPANPDPARLKRDLDRLLRASASWDRAGRS